MAGKVFDDISTSCYANVFRLTKILVWILDLVSAIYHYRKITCCRVATCKPSAIFRVLGLHPCKPSSAKRTHGKHGGLGLQYLISRVLPKCTRFKRSTHHINKKALGLQRVLGKGIGHVSTTTVDDGTVTELSISRMPWHSTRLIQTISRVPLLYTLGLMFAEFLQIYF